MTPCKWLGVYHRSSFCGPPKITGLETSSLIAILRVGETIGESEARDMWLCSSPVSVDLPSAGQEPRGLQGRGISEAGMAWGSVDAVHFHTMPSF